MEKGDVGGEEIEGIEGIEGCGGGHDGGKKLWEEKKIWKRNSFLQADASNFVQEDLEVKDQNFGARYSENYS